MVAASARGRARRKRLVDVAQRLGGEVGRVQRADRPAVGERVLVKGVQSGLEGAAHQRDAGRPRLRSEDVLGAGQRVHPALPRTTGVSTIAVLAQPDPHPIALIPVEQPERDRVAVQHQPALLVGLDRPLLLQDLER